MVALLFSIIYSNAQKINGKLIDSKTKENIPYANVALLNSSGEELISGTISDFDGKFKITASKGNYNLHVTVIGYTDFVKENIIVNDNLDLGKLKLSPSDLVLNEVMVTAERSYIENKPGKQILNVGKDISSRGGNITAVIKAIPSVEVTPRGDISIRGNSNIKILINGKQPPFGVDAKTLLKQFPASSIDRIEVITNASAKDDPESAGGAINVITKKNEMDGFHLALNGEIGMKPLRSNAGLTMNYAKNGLNTYLTYAYYQEKYLFDNKDKTNYSTPSSLIKNLRNKGNGDYLDKGHLVLGGMDYKINNNNNLNMELMYNNYKNDWGYNSNNNYTMSDNSKNSSSTTNRSNEDISFSDIAINYKYQDDEKRKLDIKTHFTSGDTKSERKIKETDEDNITHNSLIDEEGVFKTFEFTADFSVPIGENGTIETGIYNDAINFKANQNVLQGKLDKTDYKFNQRRHALYGIYEHKFGKFSASAGLRAEYYISKTKEPGKKASNQKYTSFFPNVKLQYDLSGNGAYNTINLAYTRSLRRPDYDELDPNIDYSNPFLLEKGNPELKPEFIDKLELGNTYSRGGVRINTTMFASLTNDVIQEFSNLRKNGVIMRSYINYSRKKSVGFELNSTLKPFKWWHISPAGMIIFSEFAKPKDSTSPYNKNGNSWKLSVANTFKLGSKHTFQIQGFYYGKNQNAYFTRNAYAQLNLGYEYSLLGGRATISASVTDVFNGGGKEDYSLIGKGFKSNSVWNANNRFFKVGFSMFIR